MDPGCLVSAVFAHSQLPTLCPLSKYLLFLFRGFPVIEAFVIKTAIIFVHGERQNRLIRLFRLAEEADPELA